MNQEMVFSKIEKMIYLIRDQKVMLDSDLAELYGVETRRLNEQVKRNIERFPDDFMLECNLRELEDLRSQFATANPTSSWNYKRRSSPMLFSENGVAMLSSVLKSKQAIQVNISIMRIFTKMKSSIALDSSTVERGGEHEKRTDKLFKIVFERLDTVERVTPKLSPTRKKIGLVEDE